MNLQQQVVVLLSFVCASTTMAAAPGPLLDLEKLAADSDIVVVARIASIDVRLHGATESVFVQIEPLSFLKGSLDRDLRLVDVTYHRPPAIGERGVSIGATRAVFLRRVGQTLGITDPYYPTLPASLGRPSEAATAFERVLDIVTSVAADPTQAEMSRREAIHSLWGVRHRTALDGLRPVSRGDSSPALRAAATAALLMAGDADSLRVAEDLLDSSAFDTDSESYVNLLAGLGTGRFGDGAVPQLGRLLSNGAVETRRRTAFALRGMRSMSAVPALKRALDDSDVEVQYTAVMALAELTSEVAGMAPSLPAFREDRDKYTAYWRNARIR